MSMSRVYIMQAKEGSEALMENALLTLVNAAQGVPGWQGAECLQDAGNKSRFILIERWDNAEAHQAAYATFDRSLRDQVSAHLGGPSDGGYFDTRFQT